MNTLEVHPEIHVKEQRQPPAYSTRYEGPHAFPAKSEDLALPGTLRLLLRSPALPARTGDAAAKREVSLTNRDAEIRIT